MSTDEPGALPDRDLESALRQNERLTRGILAAVPGGVVHVLADGSIHTANAEALRILGLSYDELTHRYTQDFDTETLFEDGTPCPASEYPVTKALVTGEPQPAMTIGVRKRDGATSFCVFRAVPVKDDGGKTTGAVVTFLDVTQRITMEETLRRSEARLKAIVASAPQVIFLVDATGQFLFVNRFAPDISTDLEATELVGTSIFAWIEDRDRAMVEEKIARVFSHGETVEYEIGGLEGIDPNYYSTRLGPVTENGRVVAVAGVVTSLTERRRAEEDRARLAAQLAEARRLEALGRLAGGVAHDFNNLLTVIRTAADLLAPALAGDPRAQRLRDITDSAARAAHLTRQLLAFGRQQPLHPRVLDLREVVEGVAPMLRTLTGARVEIVTAHDDDVPCVRADRVELERVLVNLVTNAEDAMPRGGRCTLHTRRAPGPDGQTWVALEVTDTGRGMDAGTLAHAFEPFFTTKDGGKNSGLGLATVHGIVAQSGGTVEVVSREGAGTTFRILLPAVDGRPDAVADAVRTPRDGRGETILLVEDDDRVRGVAKRVLEDRGYRVIDHGLPEEAAAIADETLASVDLLVTDMVMPKLGGTALAKLLRQRAPSLAVLVMSGHLPDGLDDLPEPRDFMPKPFDQATLSQKVRGLIERAGRQAS